MKIKDLSKQKNMATIQQGPKIKLTSLRINGENMNSKWMNSKTIQKHKDYKITHSKTLKNKIMISDKWKSTLSLHKEKSSQVSLKSKSLTSMLTNGAIQQQHRLRNK